MGMPLSFKKAYDPNATEQTPGKWPGYYISEIDNAVDLDAVYSGLAIHSAQVSSWLVLVADEKKGLFTIVGVQELSRAKFATSGKVTRIKVSGDNWADFKEEVQKASVYVLSEALSLEEAPDTSSVDGYQVVLDREVVGLREGQTLIITGYLSTSGAENSEGVKLKSVNSVGDVSQLVFESSLGQAYKRDTVSIYANVARATHGETVHQILGNGEARQNHQRFVLKHAPLTFLSGGNETGARASLEVRVNDILWQEVPTLFGAGPSDMSYVPRIDESGVGEIQFGDGRRGARIPTGQNNVRAIYRKGIGKAGNLKAGQLSQLLTRPLGLKAGSNPLPATGGVDPDSANDARRNMPLGVRTLGRVVSVQDYEDYARAYTGITKAQATVLTTRAGTTVFITVAGEPGNPIPETTLSKLLKSLMENGDPLVRCELGAYWEATFRVGLRIKCDPTYEFKKVADSVETTLRAAFSFERANFGHIVARSEIIGVAHSVAGVRGIDLDRFYRGSNPTLEKWLTPEPAFVDGLGNAVAAELLLLDHDGFDYLEEMP